MHTRKKISPAPGSSQHAGSCPCRLPKACATWGCRGLAERSGDDGTSCSCWGCPCSSHHRHGVSAPTGFLGTRGGSEAVPMYRHFGKGRVAQQPPCHLLIRISCRRFHGIRDPSGLCWQCCWVLQSVVSPPLDTLGISLGRAELTVLDFGAESWGLGAERGGRSTARGAKPAGHRPARLQSQAQCSLCQSAHGFLRKPGEKAPGFSLRGQGYERHSCTNT